VGLDKHPKWQFDGGADIAEAVCVGNHNKATFHGMFVAANDAHHPKAHLVMCDYQWDPALSPVFYNKRPTLVSTVNCPNATFNNVLGVFNPPLGAANVVALGVWQWTDGVKTHNGPLDDANVTVEPGRGHPSEVKVTVPNVCP